MYMECPTYRPSIVESVHRSTLKSRNDSFQGMKIVQLKQFLYDSQILKRLRLELFREDCTM